MAHENCFVLIRVDAEVSQGQETDTDARLRDLLAEVGQNRLDSLAGIYRLCARDLYGLALWRSGSPEDAADVVQEVFVRLATTRARLDRVRRPRSYLLQITHRCAVDLLRGRRRREHEELDAALLVTVAADAELATEAAGLNRHLRRLPPAQREVIYLHHFAGLSFAAIGGVTGVPKFTAASRYRLGLGRLRRLMGVES
jgi:RNA polymerase sigma-70 factor (ECF subfamily)